MPDRSRHTLLLNLYHYRLGLWLPQAYVAAIDEAGQPTTVKEMARSRGLGLYRIETTPATDQLLEWVDQVRDEAIGEAHRRGGKKMPTLSGLIDPKSKERPKVFHYVHRRVSALLDLCRTHGFPVTINLPTRGNPREYSHAFPTDVYVPRLYIDLDEQGLNYRLRLLRDGQEEPVRLQQKLRVLTNRPAPGWVAMNGALHQIGGLNGDQLKPFLSKDEVVIPSEKVGAFFREFLCRAAVRHELIVTGFDYRQPRKVTGMELTARLHPFEQRYYLHPRFLYDNRRVDFGEPEDVRVEFAARPPFWLDRVVRDRVAEEKWLEPLWAAGFGAVSGTNAITLAGADGDFADLEWFLRNEKLLTERGITVVPAREEERVFATEVPELGIDYEQGADWLDLRGTVLVGETRVPFASFVRYLQRGERRFPLADGRIFLIPEAWFTKYRPSLQFARVEGRRVRMARSHRPLLAKLGLVEGEDDRAAEWADNWKPSQDLRATLRPYQLAGARWLVKHYHQELGACLADDMGLGKTLQTIAVLLYAKENVGADAGAGALPGGTDTQLALFGGPAADESFLRPLRALVVLPASLVFNWRAELERFAPSLSVHVNTGSKRHRDPQLLRRFDVILTTYQTALRDKSFLAQVHFEYIVLDESQQIKNRQSKVFRALNELPARHRVSLSGTPIENSLSDLWAQMQFINPGLLRNFAFFKKAFITPIEVHDDAARKEQLRQLVQPHLLRRTKQEVAPELPELDVQQFYCEMTEPQRKIYEAEKSAARNALLGTHQAQDGQYKLRIIQTLTRLRQMANHPVLTEEEYTKGSGKFSEVMEQWDVIRRSGQKVLLFSSLVSHLELFRAELDRLHQPYAWITGAIAPAARAREVRRFQEDPTVQTFFISIKAGGTGLNLTAADYVFILDPWWNPTIEDQAIARAHRIGRTGNVFARKFLTRGTIEEKINKLQARKKQLAEDIIGTGGTMDFDRGELEFLLG